MIYPSFSEPPAACSSSQSYETFFPFLSSPRWWLYQPKDNIRVGHDGGESCGSGTLIPQTKHFVGMGKIAIKNFVRFKKKKKKKEEWNCTFFADPRRVIWRQVLCVGLAEREMIRYGRRKTNKFYCFLPNAHELEVLRHLASRSGSRSSFPSSLSLC